MASALVVQPLWEQVFVANPFKLKALNSASGGTDDERVVAGLFPSVIAEASAEPLAPFSYSGGFGQAL